MKIRLIKDISQLKAATKQKYILSIYLSDGRAERTVNSYLHLIDPFAELIDRTDDENVIKLIYCLVLNHFEADIFDSLLSVKGVSNICLAEENHKIP